jgi:molybdate transport system ATP-binding protein
MLDLSIRKKQGEFTLDICFSTSENGVTALFGNSGAGKTTVINMIAGLVRPDQGHIAANGRVLFDSEKRIDISPEKRRIGYIFQEGRLFPHLSVRSNLVYGMKLTPHSKRFVQFDQVVDLLGIESILDRRPAKLSGGEKQRVAIGRALLTSPSLLLMDEPLASLDNSRKAEVLPFIAGIGREFKLPILYVSHSPNEVISLANNLVLIDSGKVVASGKIKELIKRLDLRCFMGQFECSYTSNNASKICDEHIGG